MAMTKIRYTLKKFNQSSPSSRTYSNNEVTKTHHSIPLNKPNTPYHNTKWGVRVESRPMSVREQMEFYINTGMSFMLHGPSGVGKTRRVEEIDPDFTAMPLWNGVMPEDVVGKVRYPNGHSVLPGEEGEKGAGIWVAPDWYNELCRKCALEPKKQHVLFIDEVANARPTTQSLIFHIALKKSISPSKGGLPENAVVVLAGNRKEESGAAYNMPEPLFRRMCAHINLEPNIPEWLEWGSEKSDKGEDRLKIHPLVSSFIASNSNRDIFYSRYDEENPEDWAIDPRGWEQVSDIIYDNKGVLRKELLENKIGEELTRSLIEYSKQPVIMLEDVLSDNYNRSEIPGTFDGKLALTLSLRYVKEREVGKVRKFIDQELGAENRALFDALWVGNNAERALQIAELAAQTSQGR